MLEAEALRGYPHPHQIDLKSVGAAVTASGRTLVVLDDDPTGTQSVFDVPVLTRWTQDDMRWALAFGSPAIYVETNSRSFGPLEAATRNREVVAAALAAADDRSLVFVSRGDSTLRGHFPLEPEVIADTLESAARVAIDGVVFVPAFPDAGRITIGGTHYIRADEGERLIPVALTEYARDTSFPYTTSDLCAYVSERSGGRLTKTDIGRLDLKTIRSGPDAVAAALEPVEARQFLVADAVVEDDLRVLAMGLLTAESRGKRFIYRVGPSFVRARIGQPQRAPLSRNEIFATARTAELGGLIIVGSHVERTSLQLAELRARNPRMQIVELDVPSLVRGDHRTRLIRAAAAAISTHLTQGDVVLQTSRTVVGGGDSASSLAISRDVSAALVEIVQRVLAQATPRYVLAKGGITSSDIASKAVRIRRATMRGPLLPGTVSLWDPADGRAKGTPFIVFAGNVGDSRALADVVDLLTA